MAEDSSYIPRTRDLLSKGKKSMYSTYFSAIGAYPKEGIMADLSFRSVDILNKRIWREKEADSENDTLGPKYNGHVPLEVLLARLNEGLNINGEGGAIDFRKVYKNVEMTWQLLEVTAIYDKEGNKKLLTKVITQQKLRRGAPLKEHLPKQE